MRIIRVFPRRTKATPTDAMAFVGMPPASIPPADEIHVSVTFTWDLDAAYRLQNAWSKFGVPVLCGGPAIGDRGGEFVPGRYVKPGYTITSRGCNNNCWFCSVPKREGGIREVPVVDGWNVLDSNLLQCSEAHQDAVFAMLSRQTRKPEFTGGLEAKRMTQGIAAKLRSIRTNRIYCAYDTPDDLDPLRAAGEILQSAGFTRVHHPAAYVLCGYPRDTMQDAEIRMRQTWDAGFMPMAMLWKDDRVIDWQQFQRRFARPAIARAILKGEAA